MSDGGTIAIPAPLDARSFRLPDIKGWVKSRWRKPPKPPLMMVVAGALVVVTLVVGAWEGARFVIERQLTDLFFFTTNAIWMALWQNRFRVEYRAWRNSFVEKPEPPVRPFGPTARSTLIVAGWSMWLMGVITG